MWCVWVRTFLSLVLKNEQHTKVDWSGCLSRDLMNAFSVVSELIGAVGFNESIYY